jgi:hypothetical protein
VSLIKHLKGAVSGFASGFASGGIWGGVAGAAVGAVAGPGNPQKTKNVGVQPQYNVTKGKVQLDPNLSPTAVAGVNNPTSTLTGRYSGSLPTSSGNWSASGLVRNAAFGGSPPSTIVPALYGGGGSTGSFMPSPNGIQSLAPGYSPTAMYHRFYTKKGTLRRVTRNGIPYKPPRMNPMNPRAARRAIRRIRGARKLLQRIERSLPKARTHRPATHRRAA